MCGISGFIDASCSGNEAELLINVMCEVIRHRGPDDQGVWVEEGVAMGMRRLSIIDISGGHQPIFNEDGSILLCSMERFTIISSSERNFRNEGTIS